MILKEEHDATCLSGKVKGIDYVECALCNFIGVKISSHITSRHNISKQEYENLHGPTTASKALERYSMIGKINGNWIARANEHGKNLDNYKAKMGIAVSKSIMSNPEERVRRSKQWAATNRTPESRKRSSDSAKVTSARPEILARRTEALARWRDEHFDEFYEKCIAVMHATWHSKPERILFDIVQKFDNSYLANQRIYDTCITSKSKRKQIDIMNKKFGVLIEFDGKYHFEPFYGEQVLHDVVHRDLELDHAVINQNLTLVRISYDQFSYKNGGHFSEDCLRQLFDILRNPSPGVHRIGSMYKNTVQTSQEQLP